MHGGVALLVDDESLVRATTATMLDDLGFEVLEAESAAEAMRARESDSRIGLLITDHLMPQVTGGELARTARVRWPELGIPIVSCYIDQTGATDIPRLAKPFSQDELARAIATARRVRRAGVEQAGRLRTASPGAHLGSASWFRSPGSR